MYLLYHLTFVPDKINNYAMSTYVMILTQNNIDALNCYRINLLTIPMYIYLSTNT